MRINYQYALAYRVAQVFFSAGTLLLVPLYFNPVEVGLYYLFMSFMALQIMFEMGLGQALLQVASHINRKERNSLDYYAFILNIDYDYKVIAIRFFLFTLAVGVLYIMIFVIGEYQYLMFAYIALVTPGAVILRLSYLYFIMESKGQVNHSNKIKLTGFVLASIIMWGCIMSNLGLYSIGISGLANATYLYCVYRKITISKRGCIVVAEDRPNCYSNELKILHSKFKISYISGYLASSTIIPIVFAMISPIEAGRLGLTLSVFSAVTIISSIFVVVNNAKMAYLIANRKFKELHYLFAKSVKYVLLSGVFLGAITLFTLFYLREVFPNFADKFMDLEMAFLLYISSISSTLIYAMAIYIRSHKIELLVGTSIISAISVVLLVTLGCCYGIEYAIYGYALSSIFISTPLTYCIFKKKYSENLLWIFIERNKVC